MSNPDQPISTANPEGPISRRPKQPSLLLPLGAVGLFIVGGAIAWTMLRGTSRSGELPLGAEVVPQTALISVSLSTDPNEWQKLQKFGTPQTRAFLNQGLEQLRDRIFESSGYNYEQDIQPWVGKEAILALLPQSQPPQFRSSQSQPAPTPPSTPSPDPPDSADSAAPLPDLPAPPTLAAQKQPLVMVLPIANPGRARQALENAKPLKSGKLLERTHNGVTIQELQSPAQQPFSFAVLDRQFLAIATSPTAIEQTIDAFKTEQSLATTPGYIDAFRQIRTPQSLASIYVNVPAAAALAAANSANPKLAEGIAQRQQNQGIAATINLEPNGILFKGISWLKPDSERTLVVENKARMMQRRLPAETALSISGGNLQRLWQDYAQGVAANPLAPIQPDRLKADIQASLGLDLDKDFLDWMGGEFAIALIPTRSETTNPFVAALVVMIQVSDRRAAEAALKKLDTAMETVHQFEIKTVQLAGQSAITWNSKRGLPTATRGWLDGNIAFFTLGAPVAETLIPKPETTLVDNELFRQTVPTNLEPNNGHFFVDVDRAIAYILSLVRLPPSQKVLTTGIRSIGVTAAISSDRTTRYDIFVMLKTGDEPKTAPSPADEN